MKLLKGMSADDMVSDLVESPLAADADRVFFHFYSFGGLKRTAQWAHLAEQDFQTNY